MTQRKQTIPLLSAVALSIRKSLRGEERLWIVFWGWFVFVLLTSWGIHIVFGSSISNWVLVPLPHPLPLTYLDAVFALSASVTVLFRALLIIMVWKCAPNTAHKLWGRSARAVMFLFALLSLYGFTSSVQEAITQHHAIATVRSGNRS